MVTRSLGNNIFRLLLFLPVAALFMSAPLAAIDFRGKCNLSANGTDVGERDCAIFFSKVADSDCPGKWRVTVRYSYKGTDGWGCSADMDGEQGSFGGSCTAQYYSCETSGTYSGQSISGSVTTTKTGSGPAAGINIVVSFQGELRP